MSTTNPEGNNSNSHDRRSIAETVNTFVDTVTDALADTDTDTEAIEAVQEAGSDVADAVEEEIQQRDDQIQELKDDLQETKDHNGKERADLSKRVSDVEEAVEEGGFNGSNPTPNGGETTIQPSELTPIEQLSQADDVSNVTDSPTVERAVSLFQNLPQWGSKTPKGIVLKPADNPLSLLEADQDVSLAWKQYYRAAEALEQLSHGSVTFFDSDRHGKMICLHEQSEAFERVVNGTLTPSSVGAKG